MVSKFSIANKLTPFCLTKCDLLISISDPDFMLFYLNECKEVQVSGDEQNDDVFTEDNFHEIGHATRFKWRHERNFCTLYSIVYFNFIRVVVFCSISNMFCTRLQ